MSFAASFQTSDRPATLVLDTRRVGPPRPRPEGATVAWIVDSALELHRDAVERRVGAGGRGLVGADGAAMRFRPASCVIDGDHRRLGSAPRVGFSLTNPPAPESGWLGLVEAASPAGPQVRVALLGRFVRRDGGAACPPSRSLVGAQTEETRALAARAQAALAGARPDSAGFVDHVAIEPGFCGFAGLARAVARTEARLAEILPPGLAPRQREIHAFADVDTGLDVRISACAFAARHASGEGSDLILRSVVQDIAAERLIAVCLLRLGRGGH